MNSPTKTPTKFRVPQTPQTPTRRALQDITNFSTPPSPRSRVENYSPPKSPRKAKVAQLEKHLHNTLQESTQKDIHVEWLDAQYSNLDHDHNALIEHSRSTSPEKLYKAIDENVRLNTHINFMEEETSKNMDQILSLEFKLEECQNETAKLRQEKEDCSKYLATRESEIEEILDELERRQTKQESLEGRILSLLQQQARDEQKRVDLVRENKGLHTDVKHASVVLKDKDKTHAEDEEALEQQHAKNTNMRNQLQEAEEDKADFENENKLLRNLLTEEKAKTKTMNDLQKELKEMTKEIEELKKKLTDNTNVVAEQVNTINELREKLSRIQNENIRLEANLTETNIKLGEAQEMQQEDVEPCMMMKDDPPIIYKVVSGAGDEDDQPAALSPMLASPTALEPMQRWKRFSNLLAPISSFLPTISIEKRDETESLGMRRQTAVQENDELEDMMGHESSEAGAEEVPRVDLDEEDNWDSNPLLPSNENGEDGGQEPSIFTDGEENEERISRHSDESDGQGKDDFRAFLHQHFGP